MEEKETVRATKTDNLDFLKGMEDKFLVLKLDDIKEYLSEMQIYRLHALVEQMEFCRGFDGKNKVNKYLVINVDEPYAPEVVEILKRNGHWGKTK